MTRREAEEGIQDSRQRRSAQVVMRALGKAKIGRETGRDGDAMW